VQKAAHTDERLMEGSSAKIVDEAGDELPTGEVGEIAAKGSELFLG
jgi:acyl-coenzyme A synthetase/AMP-(fatty) acid ligase